MKINIKYISDGGYIQKTNIECLKVIINTFNAKVYMYDGMIINYKLTSIDQIIIEE